MKYYLTLAISTFLFVFSCQEKKLVESEVAQMKGWVEYRKKITEHPSGINYPAGYRQYELKKLLAQPQVYRSSVMGNENSSSSSAAATAVFRERGPGNVSGRTRAIMVDAADATGNTYLAASIGGGIWRGYYNPTTFIMEWENLSPDIQNLDFVSLAQSPANPNVIYAGTGEKSLSGDDNGDGIYKSDDGGLSWSNITPLGGDGRINPAYANVYRIIVDPSDENTLIIAAENKYWCNSYIYKSTDGGANFNEVLDAATLHGGCGAVTQVVYAPTNFNIQYAAVKSRNVLKSTDAGTTWVQTSDYEIPGAGSYHSRNEIVVSHSDPDIIYASIASAGDDASITPRFVLNVSYNGGNDWHYLQENIAGNSDFSPGGNYPADRDDQWVGRQSNYNNFIAINPFYDSIVYVGDINIHKFTVMSDTTKISTSITDVYQTFDNDVTAEPYNYGKKNGYVHPDQHTMTIFSDGISNFKLIVGNDGGPAISDFSNDPGVNDKSWQASGYQWAFIPSGGAKPSIDNGYVTTQFYHASKVKGKDQYLGGTQDNGTYLTVESAGPGIYDANRVNSGDGFDVITHWDNPLKMMAVCQNNGCAAISTDGGANGWMSFDGSSGFKQADDEGNPFYSKLESSKQDPDMIYGITRKGVIRSDNFGNSWTYQRLGDNTAGANVDVSDANPRFVYVGGKVADDQHIYLSKDWGNNFDTISSPLPGGEQAWTSGIYTHPTEDSTVYALFSYFERSKIFESKDLGATWQDLTGYPDNFQTGNSTNGFPNVSVNAILVMPHDPNIIWAGTEIGLMETTDRGQTWNLVNSDLPYVMINDFELADEGQIVIATYGRGIWTATVPGLVDYKPKESGVSLTFDNDTIYEANGVAELQYQLSRDLSPYSPMKIVFSLSGTASGADYTINSPDTFEITNSSSSSLSISTVQDEINEGFETLNLTASYIENGTVIGDEQIKIVIQDDDSLGLPGVTFDVDKTSISEDGESFNITAQLTSQPSSGNVEINFEFVGTAGSEDYSVSQNPLIISSGTSGVVTVTSIQDDIDEDDETIIISAQNITNAYTETMGNLATVTIIDDDDTPLSVENNNVKGISIYPNPAKDHININFDDSWLGDVEIDFYDIFGRNLKKLKVVNTSSSKNHKLDISDNSDGIFILKLLHQDKTLIRKIIKR